MQAVDGDVLDQASVYGLDRDGRTVRVINLDVGHLDVAESAARCGAEFDTARARTGHAVAHLDVLADAFRIVRLEADRVVGRIEERVGQLHAVAVDDVDAVVVPESFAVHGDAVDVEVLALVVDLHPEGRVFPRYVVDLHVFALAQEDQRRTRSGTVVFQLVLDHAFLDLVDVVVRGFSALAVDHAPARNADVLGFVGEDQAQPCAGNLAVVVRVGRAQQHGAFVEVDRHVAFQFDRTGQVTAHVEDEAAAALFVDVVDRFLDRGGVHRRTVRFDAEQRRIVVLGLGSAEAYEQQERENQGFCFFHVDSRFICKCFVKHYVFGKV